MVLEMKMDKLFLLENIASVVGYHIFVELILTVTNGYRYWTQPMIVTLFGTGNKCAFGALKLFLPVIMLLTEVRGLVFGLFLLIQHVPKTSDSAQFLRFCLPLL